uniref:transketolase n=1 Tax=Sciurus vulgaris TaxID=55149 RepID=A0A8D2AU80_SCIVU
MEGYHKPDQQKLQALKDTANRLRISSIQATMAAGSCHPTPCCSAPEIMAVLFFHTMRYKAQDPRNPHNDHFVLSKAFTDMATGSLGQGLSAACGMAHTGKYFDKASYSVYCVLGDGELSEGSMWEAMAFTSIYKLDNLVTILDINHLGQSDPAPLQHQVDIYQKCCKAFGWHAIIVDGHSVEELCKAFDQAKHQPTAIIAKTKGRRITGIIQEIYNQIQNKKKILETAPQEDARSVDITNICMPTPPTYKVGDKIATHKVYGQALAKLGHVSERIIALDGDTKNSTFLEFFKKEHPDRVGLCHAQQDSALQQLFCDLLHMGLWPDSHGGHLREQHQPLWLQWGLSIGEDGPSQMALEDLAMFRSIPTSTVFYPSDGVATEKAVELAANTKGVCFIQTSCPENAIIYNNEDFKVGQAKVVLKSKDDHATVIGGGVTLHEALVAAELLKKEKINIRVLEPFTIKPLDRKLILDSAQATKGRILTVEDHYYEGGIGEAVSTAVAGEPGVTVTCLAVAHVPRSGKPAELLRMFGIDKDSDSCVESKKVDLITLRERWWLPEGWGQ